MPKVYTAWGKKGMRVWLKHRREAENSVANRRFSAYWRWRNTGQMEFRIAPIDDPHFAPTGGQLATLGRRNKQ